MGNSIAVIYDDFSPSTLCSTLSPVDYPFSRADFDCVRAFLFLVHQSIFTSCFFLRRSISFSRAVSRLSRCCFLHSATRALEYSTIQILPLLCFTFCCWSPFLVLSRTWNFIFPTTSTGWIISIRLTNRKVHRTRDVNSNSVFNRLVSCFFLYLIAAELSTAEFYTQFTF